MTCCELVYLKYINDDNTICNKSIKKAIKKVYGKRKFNHETYFICTCDCHKFNMEIMH